LGRREPLPIGWSMARQLAIAVALIAASGLLVAAMLLATQVSGP
jgi:hypothetical protein